MNSKCLEVFDKVDNPHACKCKGIVLKTYANLVNDNAISHKEALNIATRVLRFHHQSSSVEAKAVVECWLFENSRQAAH